MSIATRYEALLAAAQQCGQVKLRPDSKLIQHYLNGDLGAEWTAQRVAKELVLTAVLHQPASALPTAAAMWRPSFDACVPRDASDANRRAWFTCWQQWVSFPQNKLARLRQRFPDGVITLPNTPAAAV